MSSGMVILEQRNINGSTKATFSSALERCIISTFRAMASVFSLLSLRIFENAAMLVAEEQSFDAKFAAKFLTITSLMWSLLEIFYVCKYGCHRTKGSCKNPKKLVEVIIAGPLKSLNQKQHTIYGYRY